ncbi:MAG: cold-shock protein [SAR324 cluster bacterium]|nr:cold-shock protein [SAR324 cluster bacterium]
MPTGTVKWFNSQKGYGFIEQESGDDLFVHHSDVEGGYLKEGENVSFEIGQGQKGPCAVKVSSDK